MLDLLRLGFLDGYTIYRDSQFCLWGLGSFCFLDLLIELELSDTLFDHVDTFGLIHLSWAKKLENKINLISDGLIQQTNSPWQGMRCVLMWGARVSATSSCFCPLLTFFYLCFLTTCCSCCFESTSTDWSPSFYPSSISCLLSLQSTDGGEASGQSCGSETYEDRKNYVL